MTTEEKITNGLNDSNIHEDFMIGSPDLTIYGILQDETKELVFKMEIGLNSISGINNQFIEMNWEFV